MKKMMMMKTLGLLLLGLVATSTAGGAAGPGSCVGRCGEVFTRGLQCTCDSSCQQHNECCPDYQATCITARSCQGRCGETFRRGLLCECDPLCVLYNTCCPDYQLHCDATMTLTQPGSSQPRRAAVSRNWKPGRIQQRSNSESEEWYTARGRCPQLPGGRCLSRFGHSNPLTVGSSGPASPVPVNHHHGGRNLPAGHLPVPSSPHGPHHHLYQPNSNTPSLGSTAPVSPSTPQTTGGNLNVVLMFPGEVGSSGLSQGVGGPAGFRPGILLDVVQPLGLPVGEGALEGSGTAGLLAGDLCSDSPINGLTALSNGTILIFKGELFWSVDPVSRSVGRPQNITETLGISSPIDTIFTRLDCNGNIYIIKGDQCWRLDGNMVMEPGYPKPLSSEFPGLTGSISAALAAPATRNRPDTVFFFKNGDMMQRFVFPPSSPSCRENPGSFPKKHVAQQAEVLLSGEINIKVSLTGFPTPITSALSMPGTQSTNRYLHFIFSGPLFFRVQISGDLPALVQPDPNAVLTPLPILSSSANMAGQRPNPSHPPNSIRFWLRCP